MTKLESVMDKLKNNKVLTDDDLSFIYKKLNSIYGDPKDEDTFKQGYPFNLVHCIFGERCDNNLSYDMDSLNKLVNNINYLLSTLEEKESKTLRLRFEKNMTLEEVAKIMHCTREKVRLTEAKALRKLRHPSRSKIIYGGKDLVTEMNRVKDEYENKTAQFSALILDVNKKYATLTKALTDIGLIPSDLDVFIPSSYISISDVNFSVRTYTCLKRAGVNTLRDICELNLEELHKIRNLGSKCVDEILRVLADNGLSLKE